MVLLTNYSVPTEAVHHAEVNVSTDINGVEIGKGTLYITESCVLWMNERDQGIQLEYKLISLHAISRDLQAYPNEHLLLHYEGKLPGMSSPELEEEDEDENENENCGEPESILVEIRFIPDNKEALESMFNAMANCQTLHPDDDCQLSDDEFEDAEEDESGDAGVYTGEDGLSRLTAEGQANLQHINQLLEAGQGDADIAARTSQLHLSNGHHNGHEPNEAGQFQDAEDME